MQWQKRGLEQVMGKAFVWDIKWGLRRPKAEAQFLKFGTFFLFLLSTRRIIEKYQFFYSTIASFLVSPTRLGQVRTLSYALFDLEKYIKGVIVKILYVV